MELSRVSDSQIVIFHTSFAPCEFPMCEFSKLPRFSVGWLSTDTNVKNVATETCSVSWKHKDNSSSTRDKMKDLRARVCPLRNRDVSCIIFRDKIRTDIPEKLSSRIFGPRKKNAVQMRESFSSRLRGSSVRIKKLHEVSREFSGFTVDNNIFLVTLRALSATERPICKGEIVFSCDK